MQENPEGNPLLYISMIVDFLLGFCGILAIAALVYDKCLPNRQGE